MTARAWDTDCEVLWEWNQNCLPAADRENTGVMATSADMHFS